MTFRKAFTGKSRVIYSQENLHRKVSQESFTGTFVQSAVAYWFVVNKTEVRSRNAQ
jgi:hypothetical protein